MEELDVRSLEAERDALIGSTRTVLMAAPGNAGIPEMGVTPYVRHDGATYIYPSRLSAHVRAILESGEGAFLIIEDEQSAQNIWARKRIKINAKITEIDRKSEVFETVCDLFADRHGPTMSLIRDFTDFHLLRLQPTDGVMVLGFAKAYRLAGPELAVSEHLRSS